MNFSDKLPTWFQNTTVGREIVEQTRKSVLEERRGLVRQIAEIQKKHNAIVPTLSATVATAKKKRDKAKAAFDEAQLAYQTAVAKESSASVGTLGRIAQLEVKLRASADPAIEKFLAELDLLYQETRHRPLVRSDRRGQFNPITEQHHWKFFDNSAARLKRLESILDAREKAEALKLEAVADLPAALDALRRSIPDGTELSLVGAGDSPRY